MCKKGKLKDINLRDFVHNSKQPSLDLGICPCGWKGKLDSCDTEPDGDWETGYYSIPLCPVCTAAIDDYDYSPDQYLKWIEWKRKLEDE